LYSGNFFQAIGPFVLKGLLSNLKPFPAPNPAYDAVDMETAAALAVATAHGVPFLGIRGISDGPGDPFGLPGFPFQFFFYKQIAAENAARVVEAFMTNWAGP
jgi:nucleoside phosphorylase